MAQLIVRNVEEDVKASLQRRAKRNRRSMEQEVREILRAAVGAEPDGGIRLGSRLRDRFAGLGLEEEIQPLRAGKPRAARLGR